MRQRIILETEARQPCFNLLLVGAYFNVKLGWNESSTSSSTNRTRLPDMWEDHANSGGPQEAYEDPRQTDSGSSI